jgi:hypothetical protein
VNLSDVGRGEDLAAIAAGQGEEFPGAKTNTVQTEKLQEKWAINK